MFIIWQLKLNNFNVVVVEDFKKHYIIITYYKLWRYFIIIWNIIN